LHALRAKVGLPGKPGLTARIEFVTLALRHELVREIESYSLWDAGYEGLGGRTLDTCFEMGDADAVAAGVVEHARAHAYEDRARAQIGEDQYARWALEADRQGSLAL